MIARGSTTLNQTQSTEYVNPTALVVPIDIYNKHDQARKKQRAVSEDQGGGYVEGVGGDLKPSYYFCCPDCALSQEFITKDDYHRNTNILRPIPDSIDPFCVNSCRHILVQEKIFL